MIIGETLKIVLVILPWVANVFIYLFWWCRAKKAMKSDNISWCGSFDASASCMFIYGLLWLPGTIMMLLAYKFNDSKY